MSTPRLFGGCKSSARRNGPDTFFERDERGERREKGKSHVPTGEHEQPKLDEIGITRKQAARWQQLAAIPEPVFEKLVRGEKPTEARVSRAPVRVAPTPKGYDSLSLERRGAFRRLCRDLVALGSPKEAAREFAEYDHNGALLDTARQAATWLADFLGEWTKENGFGDVGGAESGENGGSQNGQRINRSAGRR